MPAYVLDPSMEGMDSNFTYCYDRCNISDYNATIEMCQAGYCFTEDMGQFENVEEWNYYMPMDWDFMSPFADDEPCYDCDDDDEDDDDCYDCDDDDEDDDDDEPCYDCDDDDEDDDEPCSDCDEEECEPFEEPMCEYMECDDNDMNGADECWKEVCSDGCYETCGLWYYDNQQEFWDKMECKDDWIPDLDPEEAYYKFREHFGEAADAAFDTYCPDGVCVADATSDFIVDNDVSGKVNDLLDDEEAKEVIITTLEEFEENFDVDTSAAQMLLSLEDAAEVSWVLDQALAEA